jgi:hypothetical protein
MLFITGNNIYGLDLRETLLRLQKEGGDALAAYILMQRIFPKAGLSYLVRGGVCHEGLAISELGIYGAYLRYDWFLTVINTMECYSFDGVFADENY